MRNWHYLHASRATGWPAQSVALSVVCSAGNVGSNAQIRRQSTLLGWSAELWMGDRGERTEVARADGIDAESFWRWLERRVAKGKPMIVWQMYAVHGLASLGMWDMLTRKEWSLNGQAQTKDAQRTNTNGGGNCVPCIVTDPPTILYTSKCGASGSVCWVDVANVGLSDWDRLCKDVGGIDGGNGPDVSQFLTGREIACNRSQRLAEWLHGWYSAVRELNLGGLRCTAAAQAWHGWKTNYLNCVMEVHTDAERLGAERRAIYGGRNECYRVGLAIPGVCEIDARGHYPSIAVSNTLPGRIAHCQGRSGYSADDAARDGYLVIADGECWVRQPVLPYRKDGRTVYPVGYWRGTYCWPEWELLRRNGGECRISKWYAYEPTDPLSGLMTALWRARSAAACQGTPAKASAIKLLMNSIIGKFCSQGKFWLDCPDEFYPEPWAAWQQVAADGKAIERYRSLAWRVQREEVSGEGDDTIPAVAAWIYSLGRVRLWEWMSIAKEEDIFYVDTDSLWTTERGLDRLSQVRGLGGEELGSLRLVEKHAWARFFGHKHYETPKGVTCAGLPRAGILRTDGGWTYWTADTPAQAAQRGESVRSELIRHTVSDRVSYHGGEIGYDGWVYPWSVNDG